jgi:ketosteroid isomerase-like protein
MSQENVEAVHRGYDALRRGDLEAFLELHDAQCEIIPRVVAVEGGQPYHGHDGLRAYVRDMRAAFREWVVEIEEERDLGDAVIIKAHFHARGRDSGVTLELPLWQTIKLRDGRATWWAVYFNEAEALEAVGPSE